MKVIYVDIDETICRRETSVDFGVTHDYSKINKLYDEGNTIVYWTARGSRKQIDWTELTKNQLEEWGAKYNELRVDKPFYDLFIEDKSLRIEEL
jgi:hypothetical protein